MLPYPEPLSTFEEYRQLKRVMKKILTCILIGCLIILKLSYISTIMRYHASLMRMATFTIWLCLAGIAFLLPLYFSATAVKGYSVFLVSACGCLVVEAAEFFVFLGLFNSVRWILLELGNFCCLLLVLTLIESLFEDRDLDEGEDIPLSETINSRYNQDVEAQQVTDVDDGLTDEERYRLDLAKFRRFRNLMWRTRSL